MKQIYSIYDKVTQEYGQPIFTPKEEILIRDLKSIVNSPDGFAFPDDLQLYKLGSFDERTGLITNDVNTFVLNVSDLLKKEVE